MCTRSILQTQSASRRPLRVPDIKALDRGISDIDHPHVFSFSYVYELPKLHQGFRVVRAITNGWRTTGLIQHHSGDALTAYMATDNSLTGLARIAHSETSANRHTSGRLGEAIASPENHASTGSIPQPSQFPSRTAPAPASAT